MLWRMMHIEEGVIHLDQLDSSFHTEAEFNNYFIIHSKYSWILNTLISS